MKTFVAESYQKNEPQSVDKFTKHLNDMLDRTIIRMHQDSNQNEKIVSFFPIYR